MEKEAAEIKRQRESVKLLTLDDLLTPDDLIDTGTS